MAQKVRGIKGQPLFSSVAIVTIAGNHVITNASTTVIKKAVGAATQVTLPVPGVAFGQRVTVKDGLGDAGTNNITIIGSGALTIDGAANYVLATNYASVTFEWNGTEWGVIVSTQTITGGALAAALTVTSAGSSALAVGPAGATNPSLQVDASTASAATGVKVKSAASGGGVAMSVISPATNEAFSLDAKGSGVLNLQATATGQVAIGNTSNPQILQVSGTITAGGLATNGIRVGSGGTAPMIFSGSSTPTISAPKGSLYLCTNGTSTSTRIFVATDAVGGWAAITTAS